jgi:hypothetical protein
MYDAQSYRGRLENIHAYMLSIEPLSVLVAEDRLLLTLPILNAVPRFA